MSEPRIYLVPFTHMDLFWLGEREECLSRGARIITAALDIVQRRPEFRFLLEDAVFVDYYLDCHPEQADELRRQVQAGRIEVGAKWAGIYQHFFPGETLVRNLLYGKQFVRERLGVDPDTVHLGDIPGYVPQFAQILAKGGVIGLVICRGGPGDQVLFRWQAPDGSTALAWNALRGYPWSWFVGLHRSLDEALGGRERRGRVHLPLEEDARQIMALTPAPILMHWGMDLVSPPEKLVDNLMEWNRRTALPMRFATPSEYFHAVEATPGIPTLQGEITSVWPTVADWRPDVWYLSSPANYALMQGENWAELARRLGFDAYSRQAVRDAWKTALQGMDHNWDGTATADSNRRHRQYLMTALFTGQEMARHAVRQIAESVKLPKVKDITPVVVFNPTSWSRTDMVTVHASFYGEVESFYGRWFEFGDQFRTLRLYDHTGEEVPFQYLHRATHITREATLCFTASDVPPFGYRLFYLAPVTEELAEEPCCRVSGLAEEDPVVVESERFRLEIARPTGYVTVYDKALSRLVADGMELIGDGVGRAHEDAQTGQVFPNAMERVEVVENGNIRARVLVRGRIGAHETLQEWIIPGHGDYVEVIDHIWWVDCLPDIFFKRILPLAIDQPQVTYGLPFGVNDWHNQIPGTGPHLPGSEPPAEVVARYRQPLHWIDVSGLGGGVTVSTERHAVERAGSTLRIALLHAEKQRFPRYLAWGDQHYCTRTRLRSHAGDWRSAHSYRDGLALFWPLLAVSVADPLSPKRLEPVASLCSVPAENVIVTTIKRAEQGEATILRGFEVAGQETEARPQIAGAPVSLYEVDLLEENPRPVGSVVWHPYEIKTLRLEDSRQVWNPVCC